MPARNRPADVAAAEARALTVRLGGELREGRLAAGLSIAHAARTAGMSPAQLGRIERGEIEPSVEQLWRAGAPVALRPSIRYYPYGSPVRDRAQLALLERFEARLRPPLRLRREVPLPIQGDLRAWDGVVEGGDEPAFIEGESHIRDAQALERRLRLMLRDDPRASVVLLVATRSAHNRRVLEEHRETMRDLLPLDGAAVLRALGVGHVPRVGGIVML